MKYRITFSFGGAGKVEPGEVLDKYNLCEGQTPRFGYYWWYWLPTWHYNGGRPSRREVLDLTFHWLRWWCAVTAWPNKREHDSDCATHNEPAYPNGPCDCLDVHNA